MSEVTEKSPHAFFDIEPQAQATLAQWGVHINGTEIVNTRPFGMFAERDDTSEDPFMKMAGRLKGIKIYSLVDGRIAYEIYTYERI